MRWLKQSREEEECRRVDKGKELAAKVEKLAREEEEKAAKAEKLARREEEKARQAKLFSEEKKAAKLDAEDEYCGLNMLLELYDLNTANNTSLSMSAKERQPKKEEKEELDEEIDEEKSPS